MNTPNLIVCAIGNHAIAISGNNNSNIANYASLDLISSYQSVIAEKDRIIAEKDRIINILLHKIHL
jgi:hypothetical protein